jgi:hypothetical protein
LPSRSVHIDPNASSFAIGRCAADFACCGAEQLLLLYYSSFPPLPAGLKSFFFFSAFILKVKGHGVPPAGLSADDKTRLSKMTHHLKTFKTIMKHLTLNA